MVCQTTDKKDEKVRKRARGDGNTAYTASRRGGSGVRTSRTLFSKKNGDLPLRAVGRGVGASRLLTESGIRDLLLLFTAIVQSTVLVLFTGIAASRARILYVFRKTRSVINVI